ncbi:hypothetical protein FACS1894181_13150 [Bacteroidia bacterium]|nr:hypothetical protein FACS1894181_13150 [Bacteroidia bacterium]
MPQLATLKASGYFRGIEYIPLETTGSSLIGRNPQIRFAGGNILVTTSQKQALLFDATGKFLRSIGHVGNDPEGYSSTSCFVDDTKGLIYFEGFGGSLVCYNFDGKHIGNIATPPQRDGFGMSIYGCLNGDTLAGYYNSITGGSPNKIMMFNASGVIDSILSAHPVQPPFEIGNISVFNGWDKGQATFGPVAQGGIIMIAGQDQEKASAWMAGATLFWHNHAETCFKEPFNDTIFVLDNSAKVPRFVLNLGEYHWDAAGRFQKSKDKNIYPTQFLENEHILFFRFVTGLYSENSRKSYDAVYNKATGELKVALTNDGFTDDITRFLPLQPLAVSPSGHYVGLLSVEDIHEWFDKHGASPDIPKEVQALKKLKEDDNPVVVLMKN